MTDAGKVIQTHAQAGAQLEFTRVAIGDGEAPADLGAMTELVRETRSVLPSKFQAMELGRVLLRGVFDNQGLLAPLRVRELGLFAIDPTDATEKLYCYSNAGEGYDTIPPEGSGAIKEVVYDIHTLVGTAPNVSATLASNVYASADALADLETRSEAAVAALLALTAANTNERLKGIF
ncbi:hypothetical protein [Phaeobacter italicus]|uniref:hypothetical protein n=1 Tax=Phaeobacter italicus TaxID=481446 RepID=UPI001C984D1B|nr:hypothetical protein [Phaeobacter italicus]MBY6045810.1 hypothetical protein [Phaeobacter italicus]